MSAVVQVQEFFQDSGWGDEVQIDIELPPVREFKSEFCEKLVQSIALRTLVEGVEYL